MALVDQMKNWTDNEWNQFHPIADRFASLGYVIRSEPLEGCFDLWIKRLNEGFEKLDVIAKDCRKAWGFRGNSKPLIARLHDRYPEPAFGVRPSLKD